MIDPLNYIQQQTRSVNAALNELLPSGEMRPKQLHEAMRYSVFAGGKRLRPMLCIAACEACGGTAEQALTAACSLELLHTSTLIHDDLPAMDDDTLRRGQPTCHIQFNEAVAILAGDALMGLSFEILSPLPNGARLVQELTRSIGKVIAGQTEDLDAEGRTPDEATVEFIHRHKTAALIRTACIMGGICADADFIESVAINNFDKSKITTTKNGSTLEKLAEYGENSGLAFQLIDDLLDESSTEEELGKDIGSDKAKGKMTWPAVHGVKATQAEAERLTLAACAAADELPKGGLLISLAQLMSSRRS